MGGHCDDTSVAGKSNDYLHGCKILGALLLAMNISCQIIWDLFSWVLCGYCLGIFEMASKQNKDYQIVYIQLIDKSCGDMKENNE